MKKIFYGLDSITKERIYIDGVLKEKINTNVEIKRGNEKLLIEDIKAQIEAIKGKEPFAYEGGSHIRFLDKPMGKNYYCIEWHYAIDESDNTGSDEDENMIKKTCKDLGVTYKELSAFIGYSESAIKNAATSEPSEPMKFAIKLYLENQALKRQLNATEEFKKHLKEFLK